MGYCTNYTLTVRNVKDKSQFKELSNELEAREIIGYALSDGTFDEQKKEAFFPYFDDVRWSNHAKDMIIIAEKFPNMYFELHGVGDLPGDFWKEYYHDMDIETCRGEVVYEQPKKVQWTELIPF